MNVGLLFASARRREGWAVLAAPVLLMTVPPTRAKGSHFSVPASEDTYITIPAGLGGPTSQHSEDTTLCCWLGSGANDTRSMARSRLAGLAGATVSGAPAVRFLLGGMNGNRPPDGLNSIQLRAITTNSTDWSYPDVCETRTRAA